MQKIRINCDQCNQQAKVWQWYSIQSYVMSLFFLSFDTLFFWLFSLSMQDHGNIKCSIVVFISDHVICLLSFYLLIIRALPVTENTLMRMLICFWLFIYTVQVKSRHILSSCSWYLWFISIFACVAYFFHFHWHLVLLQ